MSRPCDGYLCLVCTKHQPVPLPIVPYNVDNVLQLSRVIREDICVIGDAHSGHTDRADIEAEI